MSAAELLPASDILTTVREMGFAPNTQVVRRGPYYVLHAVDLRGIELRIVADAQFGDILLVEPAWPYNYTPYYVRAPHIIHVPPPAAAKPRKRSEAAPLQPERAAKPDAKRGTAAATAKDAPVKSAATPLKALPKDE